jgi:hypothetical protein
MTRYRRGLFLPLQFDMALPLDEALPAPPPVPTAAATTAPTATASATVDLLAFDDLHVSAPPPPPATQPPPAAAAADPFADMLSGGQMMPPVHTCAAPMPTMPLSNSPVRSSSPHPALFNHDVAACSRWYVRAFTASFRPSLNVCTAGDTHRFDGHQRRTALVSDPQPPSPHCWV